MADAPIPPDDAAWIAARTADLARELYGTTPPSDLAKVHDAALAASWIAARYMAPGDPATLVPAPDVAAGVNLLAVRVFHDPRSPAGSLASDAYAGVYVPADLLAHVHHYFDPFRVGGPGIA